MSEKKYFALTREQLARRKREKDLASPETQNALSDLAKTYAMYESIQRGEYVCVKINNEKEEE